MPFKKGLSISNGYSEAVNRMTNNTMTKRKGTNNDKKTLHRKLTIEQQKPTKAGMNPVLRNGK
jgi:hypothetical protein